MIPNYFDIVNSEMIINTLIDRFNYTEGTSKSTTKVVKSSKQVNVDFGVNTDQFNFFLQRRQMDII